MLSRDYWETIDPQNVMLNEEIKYYQEMENIFFRRNFIGEIRAHGQKGILFGEICDAFPDSIWFP